MIQELLYTSHQGEGLRKGSGGGFCTVLSTNAMAPNLAQALEKLSGYKHPFDAHDSRASKSPVNYRFTALRIGGRNYHIFSRVSDYRAEHTGRTNKIAHHLVADASLRPDCGPAAVLASSLMRKEWDGNTGVVPPLNDNALLLSSAKEKPCQSWAKITGDAGWAGFVAEKLFASPDRPISVIFPVGSDPLALVSDLFALIPATFRWEISFSTYFTTLPPGTSCRLRFLMDQTSEAEALRRDLRQETFDLMDRKRLLTESTFTEAARAGVPFRLETPGHARHQSSVMIGTRAKSVDELELEPLRVSDGDLVEIPPSISRRSEVPVAVELPSGRNKSGPPALPSTPDYERGFSKSKKNWKWTQGLLVGLAAGLLVGLFGGFGIGKYVFVAEPKSSEPSLAESNPVDLKSTVGRPPTLNSDDDKSTVVRPEGVPSEGEKSTEADSTGGAPKTDEPEGDDSLSPFTEGSNGDGTPKDGDRELIPKQPASKTIPADESAKDNTKPSVIDVSLLPNGLPEEYKQDPAGPNSNLLRLRPLGAPKPHELTIDHDFGGSFHVTGEKDLLEKLQHCVYQVKYSDAEGEDTKYFYFPQNSELPKTPKAIAELTTSTDKYYGLWIRIVKPGTSNNGTELGFKLSAVGDAGAVSDFDFNRLSVLNLTLEILYGGELLGLVELSKPEVNKWRFLQIEPLQAAPPPITRRLAVLDTDVPSPQKWLFDNGTKELFRIISLQLLINPLSNDPSVKRIMDENGLEPLFKKWQHIQHPPNFQNFKKTLEQPVLEVYLPPDDAKQLPERVVFQYSILKP